MQKQRIPAIEYIRGISMLGVIGIHVGSQALVNPHANIHLIALLEIFTRFSVPIFFFISAFGLFYNLDPKAKFNYRQFMLRRFKTVLIPYLVWSAIYIMHYTLLYHDLYFWQPLTLLKVLFFGLASYQLYFLVILLWFYLLMPVWLFIVNRITILRLALLLIIQIAIDYYSSYIISSNVTSPIIKELLEYRLNYWVIHYAFIFILGGYAAIHYVKFNSWLKTNYKAIQAFFFLSLGLLLTHYYYLIYKLQYSPESAINTAHQLSPAGIFYTIGASLFFFALFSFHGFSTPLQTILSSWGKHSYFAYLFHPLALYYLSNIIEKSGLLMTAPVTIILYCCVLIVSMIVAIIMRSIGARFPLINIMLIGVYLKKK